jgi:hypothetical protein
MNWAEFERSAWREWERIPDAYKAGVDGLVLTRDAKSHPTLPDVYTLGECITEAYPSDWGGPETIRSFVVLYYGSFRRLAALDAEFDWGREIWETLTHELQHHLESLAADDALVAMDHAVDEDFKRREGAPFDPFFYRSGEALGGGWFRVDEAYYLEVPWAGGPHVDFELRGRRYRVTVPAGAARVAFLDVVDGLPGDAPAVGLVLVRRRGVREMLRALIGRGAAEVRQADVVAVALGDGP